MKTREIKIDIQTAKKWYDGDDTTLKELALQAFSVKELTKNFRLIETFEDACGVLKLSYESLKFHTECVAKYSKASAAMLKLNIIRKALNLGQDLRLTQNPKYSYIYYPFNPFVKHDSTYFIDKLNSGEMEVIGRIKSGGEEYNVLGGAAYVSSYDGLGSFYSDRGVGRDILGTGFLGCAEDEIAQHLGKYFGMLVTEAKYGDLVDFDIIASKYPN